MATTLYKFQSDLTGLIALNKGLKEAQVNLQLLKKGTLEYAAASKGVGVLAGKMKTNTAAIRKTTAATRSLTMAGSKMVAIFKSASIAIAAAFAFRAIIGGITGVIKIFAKFESQMAAVKAISGATESEFESLSESAKELGRTTVFTATQVAVLQEEFARLGFTAPQILAAQEATLSLAAATGENLASAAAIAGSSLKAFNLEAEQITRVTNVMGASFTGSALNLERFTQSMKFAAPVAQTAGFTIEETSAMLMTLADAGLHGSIAGNALKNIFLRLGDSNSSLNKHIGKTVQGLPQLIVEMEKMKAATFGLTEATTLLDKRSAPAFLILLKNIKELELNSDILNKAEGDISRMAAIRLDTLTGDFQLLQSATEGLGLAIGDAFAFQMRKSTFGITKWIQKLAESEKFINQVVGTVKLLSMAIQLFMVRMAAMRLVMLVSGKSMVSFSLFVKLVARSFTSARAQATLFRVAMTGVKAAIASTGIGLLVVGLGELVAWLGSGSDAADEHAFAMGRLYDSFVDEMSVVQKLGVYTSERHDKLREMNATYEKLIGNIDLEIQSQRELDIINGVVADNALSGIGNQVAAQEKLRDAAIETAAAKDEEALAGINIAKASKDEGKDVKAIGLTIVKMTAEDWDNDIKRWKEYRIKTAKEQKGIIDDFNTHIETLETQQKTEASRRASDRGIDVDANETYRMELRDSNIRELENFRALNFGKQTIREDEAKQKLEDLQRAQELLNQASNISKAYQNNEKDKALKYTKTLTIMINASTKGAQEQYSEFAGQHGKINVMISEYQKYVTNLSKVLDKSGKSYGDSALSGFRLNKTKDRLKELLDLKVKQINDSFKHDIAAEEASHKWKMQKYNKEKDLIATNIKSIASIKKSATKKQLIADLKANRTKYDSLKNIDQKGWDELMAGKGVQISTYHEWLDKMNAEEVAKQVTNKAVIEEVEDVHGNEIDKITRAQEHKIANWQLDIRAQKLRNMDEDLSFLKDNQALRLKEFEIAADEEERQDKALVKSGEMNAIEAMAREKAREQDLTDFKRKQNQERLAAISETYQQMAGMIMEMSARVAAAKIADLESDFEEQTTHEDNVFRRKLEIAEAAGGDTEAMQETHDDKMNALERIKEGKIIAIKKRQFRLEKANNVAMAIINGAQAIAKVTAQTGIGAIVAAPLTATLIAAQIAMILSQKFTGAKGGIIPGGDDKFAKGGMVIGNSHAQGGVKFAVGGRVAELEGGEAVINKRSTALFKPQLSAMNSHNGYGKKFAKGGITPGTRAAVDASKGTWNANDIAGLISDSINQQQVYVTEADITSTQDTVSISEGLSSIFK